MPFAEEHDQTNSAKNKVEQAACGSPCAQYDQKNEER
jgi:hypothetical protein